MSSDVPSVTLLKQFAKSSNFSLLPSAPFTKIHSEDSIVPSVDIFVEAVKISEVAEVSEVNNNRYEVLTRVEITIKDIFVMSLVYSGLFELQNVNNEELSPLLLVYAPSITFPFVRQIVFDITASAGLSPLMLSLIDFSKLYEETIEEPIRDEVVLKQNDRSVEK